MELSDLCFYVRRWFATVLLGGCLVAFSSAFSDVQAQARCGSTKSFDNLMDAMASAHTQNRAITIQMNRKLTALAAKVDLVQLHARFREIGRTDLVTSALRVSYVAKDLRNYHQLALVSPDLEILRRGIDAVCRKRPSTTATFKQVISNLTAIDHPFEGHYSLRASNPGLNKLVVLILVLTAILATIFFSYRLYRWGFAQINGRRSCSTPAMLWIEGQVYEGTVKVLGRKGCLFEPKQPSTLQIVATNSLSNDTHVVIGGVTIPTVLYTKNDASCGMLFEKRISMLLNRALLKYSTRTPKILTTRPPRANIPMRKVTHPRVAYR